MADIKNANIEYILRWEGGLSKDTNDSASKNCVPDGSGTHTNKGITWASWRSQFGSDKDSIARFYKMDAEDWRTMYKGYWDGMKADLIISDLIAEFWVDFAWGSGVRGASKQLQYCLNDLGCELGVDGVIGPKTIKALNTRIDKLGEKRVYNESFNHRCNFLASLSSFQHFGRGWMNRLRDFNGYAQKKLIGG